MSMSAENLEQDAFQANFCADRLKALGDPLRLRIIDLLRQGELTVSEIAEQLETGMVTVSHHLQILKHAHLVESQREGRFIRYRLPEDLLQKEKGDLRQFLDLGCCRLEVPKPDAT